MSPLANDNLVASRKDYTYTGKEIGNRCRAAAALIS